MRILIGDETVELEVEDYYEYPRGPDGLCALCKGDPCNEESEPDSLIARWWAANPHASTCPVCDGRPT
ncbi:MAG TPA: hypothetical protein VGD46_19585 [Rhizobacter sp.]